MDILLNKLDTDTLSQAYTQTQRLQIQNLLSEDFCRHLTQSLDSLTWQIVLNEGDKHFDIHPAQILGRGAPVFEKIKQGIYQRAETQFQYFYENHPVTDALDNNRPLPEAIVQLYTLFNSTIFINLIHDITARQVDYCDMQATQYRSGHFLTQHDDGVTGKNRQLAYVLNLSQDWQANWGGQLEFFNDKGQVIDSFLPRFNSLSLFSVPMEHQVSQVTSLATRPRRSFTGWFRLKDQ